MKGQPQPPDIPPAASPAGDTATLRARRATSDRLRRELLQRQEESKAQLVDLHEALDRSHALRTQPDARRAQAPSHSGMPDDLWLLHVKYRRSRSDAALATLVEQYRPAVERIAHQWHRPRVSWDDISQVAMTALVAALERFDPDKGIPFMRYASPTIVGAIKHYYRDQAWAMRMPRKVHDHAGRVESAGRLLAQRLGRPPRPQEIAEETSLDVATVQQVRNAEAARQVRSLGSIAHDGAAIADASDDLSEVENRLMLVAALRELPERDRLVLRRYYVEELSQAEIAAEMGVSQMQISRWLSSALARLRSHL